MIINIDIHNVRLALPSRSVTPAEHRLVPRAHVLVELICFVHFVRFGLFGVQPALEEFGVVFREGLITVFDLAEFKLECADLVVEDLRVWAEIR
jgi:hypothetical protein